MSKFTRFSIGLMCLVCASGFAMAQGSEGKADTVVNANKTQVAAVQIKPPSYPALSPQLETLRYKHLWIAYSLIWLIVFLFMYRTYKVGTSNRESLEALKSRLALLEKQDG
jgi:hypothetical protein